MLSVTGSLSICSQLIFLLVTNCDSSHDHYHNISLLCGSDHAALETVPTITLALSNSYHVTVTLLTWSVHYSLPLTWPLSSPEGL